MRVPSPAEIRVPGVEVGIEMDQCERPEASGRRPEERQSDRMVATQRENVSGPLGDLSCGLFDLPDRLLDPEWGAGDVAGIGNLTRERLGLRPRVVRTQHPGSGADGGGPEARAGPVDDAAVERDADDRDLGLSHGIKCWQAGEGRRARETWHLHWIDRPDHVVAHQSVPSLISRPND